MDNKKRELTEATSEDGITIGLIDSIIAIANAIEGKDLFDDNNLIQEAVKDLRSNDTMKRLMDIGDLQDAKDYIEEQRKTIRVLTETPLNIISALTSQPDKDGVIAELRHEQDSILQTIKRCYDDLQGSGYTMVRSDLYNVLKKYKML